MLRVLLIKTSSLGDVVHNFPVVSDIRHVFPDAIIDWVVEEPFVPLAQLHSAIGRVLPVAVRRWRKQFFGRKTWQEVAEFRRLSQLERYDAVIDTQGLIKSALIAQSARGRRHGFDRASAREPLASRFYDVTHHVARHQHAVLRNRQLAAASLGYRIEHPIRYGLRSMAPCHVNRGGPYAVLLHATSRVEKQWPMDLWRDLVRQLEKRGIDCVIPWGSESERERSVRIAGEHPGATVPPQLPLDKMAKLIAGGVAAIGVDTGLTHLAAALNRPVIGIYVATDPAQTGVFGADQVCNVGKVGVIPSPAEVLMALDQVVGR